MLRCRCLATDAGTASSRLLPNSAAPALQVSQQGFWILIPGFKTQMGIGFPDQTRKKPGDWVFFFF